MPKCFIEYFMEYLYDENKMYDLKKSLVYSLLNEIDMFSEVYGVFVEIPPYPLPPF